MKKLTYFELQLDELDVEFLERLKHQVQSGQISRKAFNYDLFCYLRGRHTSHDLGNKGQNIDYENIYNII